MKEIFDVDRLLALEDKESWRMAYEEEIEKLDRSFRDLALIQFDSLTEEVDPRIEEEIQRHHYQLFSNPQLTRLLERWENKESDPWWKRRLQILKLKSMESEIESHPEIVSLKCELQTILMNQSFEAKGQSFSFASIQVQFMNQSDRALREDLFLQLNQFAEQVTPVFRKLVKARNELAQQKGYNNYYEFAFEGMMGLDIQSYREQVRQLLDGTAEISQQWEQRFGEKFNWAATQYYDVIYAALHFYEIPVEPFSSERLKEAIEFTCRQLELNPNDLPIQIELSDIPFGGLMTAIAPDDIRLVVKRRDGYSGFAVGLHELGHALYEYYSAHQRPELFRFKNLIGHEAMAEMFMTIASQREWLIDFINADESLIENVQGAEHLFTLTLTKLYFYQSLLEQSIYENPDQDLQELSNQCFAEVFDLKAVAMHPAVDVMFTLYPVYTHTYLYADGIREMIRADVDRSGLYKNKALLEKLRQSFMEPSESLSWQEKVRELCGQEFHFSALGDYLAQKSYHYQKYNRNSC